MPVALLDTFHVLLNGTCFSQRIRTRLTYVVIAVNPVVDPVVSMNEIIAGVQAVGANNLTTNYLTCLPTSYTLNEVRGQWLRATKLAYISSFPVASIGTNANPATVACDSAAVVRRASKAGRKYISTLKLGPVPDGGSASGLLVATYKALATNFGNDTLKTLSFPVSGIIAIPTILQPNGLSTDADLKTLLIPNESRVMRRRVVGRGE